MLASWWVRSWESLALGYCCQLVLHWNPKDAWAPPASWPDSSQAALLSFRLFWVHGVCWLPKTSAGREELQNCYQFTSWGDSQHQWDYVQYHACNAVHKSPVQGRLPLLKSSQILTPGRWSMDPFVTVWASKLAVSAGLAWCCSDTEVHN